MGVQAMSEQEYADFDISIRTDGTSLIARVISSPAGSSDDVELPPIVDDVPMRELLLRLENAVLRADEGHRRWASPGGKVLREFGRQAFDSVFLKAPVINEKFSLSLARVTANPALEGLRVKLRLPPALSQLPWEYLYDQRSREHLCLRERSPLVRFIDQAGGSDVLEVDGPLRVLGVIANPKGDWRPLDVARERRVIDEAVAELQRSGRIEFRWAEADTGARLLDVMGRGPWHVFHFIGHGGIHAAESPDDTSEGFIVLLDEDRNPVEVPASKLKYWLKRSDTLRLVVLNCCESARGHDHDPYASPGAALVLAGIPAVVAMQYPIRDPSAICFAQHFYQALCENQSVERALTGARLHMHIQSDVEWGIPVLFSGAPTSRLFNIAARDTTQQAPQPQAALNGHGAHVARSGHGDASITQEIARAELRALFQGSALLGAGNAQERR